MMRGFFFKSSRSSKIVQNVIFHVKNLVPDLNVLEDFTKEVLIFISVFHGMDFSALRCGRYP